MGRPTDGGSNVRCQRVAERETKRGQGETGRVRKVGGEEEGEKRRGREKRK